MRIFLSASCVPAPLGTCHEQAQAAAAVAKTSMPRMEDAPPLYKPELIEPKKRLSILQRCYKEPWVPIGQHTGLSSPACACHPLPHTVPLRLGVSCPWQAA